MAALFGGLIALGGAGLAQYLGYLGVPGPQRSATQTAQALDNSALDDTRTALETQIASLREDLSALQTSAGDQTGNAPAAPAVDLAAIDGRIDERVDTRLGSALDTRINQAVTATLDETLPQRLEADRSTQGEAPSSAALEAVEQQASQTSQQVQTLQDRLVSAEETLNTLGSAISSGTAGEDASLAALDGRLSALADQMGSLSTDTKAALDETAGKLAQLETSLAEQQQPDVEINEATQTALGQISDKVDALGASVAEQQDQLTAQLEALKTEEIAGLREDLGQRIGSVAEQANKVSGLTLTLNTVREQLEQARQNATEREQQLNALQKATAETTKADKKAAQAIAAAALKGDMDAGRRFDTSLATFRQVSEDETMLQPLDAYAESGVPTLAQLNSRFDSVSDAILGSVEPPADGSFTSRLFSGAKGLIKIKPLQPVEGDTPAAIVSRMNAALDGGDLQQVDTLWQSLPSAARDASKDWHGDVLARLSANKLVGETVQSFLLSTSGG